MKYETLDNSEALRDRLLSEFGKAVDAVMTEIVIAEKLNPGEALSCQLLFTAGSKRVVMCQSLELMLNMPKDSDPQMAIHIARLACGPRSIKQMVEVVTEAGDAVGFTREETAQIISDSLASANLPIKSKMP